MDPLNFDTVPDKDVAREIMKRMPGGPDRTIECVGFRYPKSWHEKMLMTLKLESDTAENIREMAFVTKKGGNMGKASHGWKQLSARPRLIQIVGAALSPVGIIGDYFGGESSSD
jgi:hypothetical protein